MRPVLPAATLLLCAACAAPAPAPAPVVVVPAEPPAIVTAAVTPATETPVPMMSAPANGRTVAPPSALPPALSREQVERTFRHHRRFFDEAYRERLRASPRLSGTLLVSFSVSPDGTVQNARVVQSNVGDPALERAVLERVDRMNFPPAAGPTPVESYPLQFSAHSRP